MKPEKYYYFVQGECHFKSACNGKWALYNGFKIQQFHRISHFLARISCIHAIIFINTGVGWQLKLSYDGQATTFKLNNYALGYYINE